MTSDDVDLYVIVGKFFINSRYCTEKEIEKDSLLCLTERCLETLIPVIGHRVKLLKLLADLRENKNAQPSCSGPVPETGDTIEKSVGTHGNSLDVSRGNDPRANSQTLCLFYVRLMCYC